MTDIFNEISLITSKLVTKKYSTSFFAGIRFIKKQLRNPVYAIYGFVRFADEIVDSFHDFNKIELLNRFKEDTFLALNNEISLNPVLNSFQKYVNEYHIDNELIESFFNSMEMDLFKRNYNNVTYKEYIYGSAEVVGLMCLKVFCQGSQLLYENLKPFARRLGAAYQKINFLRDLSSDYIQLGRIYFPGISIEKFSKKDKKQIENDIKTDFNEGLRGIKQLPNSSKLGVYLSYRYFYALFKKVKRKKISYLLKHRIRISNFRKLLIAFYSFIICKLRLI